MTIEISDKTFTACALRVLRWAKGYAQWGKAAYVEPDDVIQGLLSIRRTVAFSVFEAQHLTDRLRTSLGMVGWCFYDCSIVETDLSETMRVLMGLVHQEMQNSGRQKIDTGHLLKVLVNHVPAFTAAINRVSSEDNTIQTIVRRVRDTSPSHVELADIYDPQIPEPSDAQLLVEPKPPADMRKPQSGDEPIKLQPVERLVTPEAFVGIIGPLCTAFPRGFESVHLQTLLAAALETYEPSDLALTVSDLVFVMRLLGWKNVARFAGLIKRLARQRNVSVQIVQRSYDSIVGPVVQETHGEIGILLQILSGNPPRKLGEPIDWLKADEQGQKPGGGLSEWP